MARARGRSMGFLDITIDLPATYSLGGGKQIGRALVSVEVLECSCAGARPRRLACGIPRLARVQKQYRLERQLPYGPPLLEPTSSGRFRRVLRQEAAEGAEPSGRRGKKGPSSTERKKKINSCSLREGHRLSKRLSKALQSNLSLRSFPHLVLNPERTALAEGDQARRAAGCHRRNLSLGR